MCSVVTILPRPSVLHNLLENIVQPLGNNNSQYCTRSKNLLIPLNLPYFKCYHE